MIIKRFRQSILTAAVTGKLTEKWREEQPDLESAKAWLETELEEQSAYITSGSRGWAKYYSDSGALFVRAQNIKTDNLILDDVAYVSLPNKAEGTRTRILKNDILITITGANVTKTAIVRTDIDEAYVNQHVALVRLNNPTFAEFIYLWLVSPSAGRAQLEETAYGAGKPGLNLQNIKDVKLKLPPLEEQKEIVHQVDKLFALADKLEAHYQKAKTHVDKLSQSVLAKAFRGELVPQDPNDEPAEKLLERIMEEKKRLSQGSRRTRRSKK
jgi:type I restriction enzyme S subunit